MLVNLLTDVIHAKVDPRVSHDSSRLTMVLCLLLSAGGVQAQSLGKRLDARLDKPPFDHQFWGVAVVDGHGKLLYGRNQDRMFIPASNTKIVVTAVASALLPARVDGADERLRRRTRRGRDRPAAT